jgi:hypothetical protein
MYFLHFPYHRPNRQPLASLISFSRSSVLRSADFAVSILTYRLRYQTWPLGVYLTCASDYIQQEHIYGPRECHGGALYMQRSFRLAHNSARLAYPPTRFSRCKSAKSSKDRHLQRLRSNIFPSFSPLISIPNILQCLSSTQWSMDIISHGASSDKHA